jgi:bifunctional hydroxylase/dehydrase
MLACELRLGGVECIVLERLAEPTEQSRALGFTSRTIEVFDQRGLLPRFGGFDTIPIGHFGGVRLDYRELEGGSYGAKCVPQTLTVAILTDWAAELGADVRRCWDVVGFDADDDGVGVDVITPDGPVRLRAAYLAGCDGGRSAVRKHAGIGFPGYDAEIEMCFALVAGCQVRTRPNGERVPGGMVLAFQEGRDVYRVVYYERGVTPRKSGENPLTFAEAADAWERLTGEDIHGGTPLWVDSFTDMSRQASEYRRGRVLLAGDAAHIHLPIGGQGMSAGVQDAVNLGWKLAAEVRGHAPPGLLDTYHSERHPVGARVLRNTRAQGTLNLSGKPVEPLRTVMSELTAIPAVARHLSGMVSGLDIRYDVHAQGHPLLGVRMADRELELADGGRTQIARLLHPARGVLITADASDETSRCAAGWSGRVDLVRVKRFPRGPEEGTAATQSVLIRPDGYVAWVAPDGGDLAAALHRWFGLARQPADSQPLVSAR